MDLPLTALPPPCTHPRQMTDHDHATTPGTYREERCRCADCGARLDYNVVHPRPKLPTMTPADYEVIAYRPTGAVVRATACAFNEIEGTIGRLRYEVRNTHGWTPVVLAWKRDGTTSTDITHWYPRA